MTRFFLQLFSESGEASFSRTGSFLSLLFSCGWVSYIVWRTHALPSFEGLTFFIVSLYGLGKAGETLQRLTGKQPLVPLGLKVSGGSPGEGVTNAKNDSVAP